MAYNNKLRVYAPTKYVFKTSSDADSKAQFNVKKFILMLLLKNQICFIDQNGTFRILACIQAVRLFSIP